VILGLRTPVGLILGLNLYIDQGLGIILCVVLFIMFVFILVVGLTITNFLSHGGIVLTFLMRINSVHSSFTWISGYCVSGAWSYEYAFSYFFSYPGRIILYGSESWSTSRPKSVRSL